jgi:hypothetical protein
LQEITGRQKGENMAKSKFKRPAHIVSADEYDALEVVKQAALGLLKALDDKALIRSLSLGFWINPAVLKLNVALIKLALIQDNKSVDKLENSL